MKLHPVHGFGHPVENNHLCGIHLVEDKLTHVGVILQECRAVCEHGFARNYPFSRKDLEKISQKPHAVIFHNDLFGVIFVCQSVQKRLCQFFLIQHRFNKYVVRRCESGRIQFLLPFFTLQYQNTLTFVEARIRQDALDERRFSGIQESREQKYRDVCHTPNNSFNASSFNSEPITQILPVTTAAPRRMSVSSGT